MRPQTAPKTSHSRVRQWLRNPLLAPLNKREAWDRLATAVHPLWSLLEARGQVIRVNDEAPGVKSIWLKPNKRFQGFRPGQHVLLELAINGARHARCFTVSNAPRADGLLRLTIKLKANGPVSAAAHALTPGQIVRLSQAQGDFAPSDSSSKLLLLSAGSGVTPMLSILQNLADKQSKRQVVLIHCGHSETDIIFAKQLQQLSAQWPQLSLHLHSTENLGHLDAGKIAAIVPDWAERETLLCGPDGFMQTVETMYRDAKRSEFLQSENFGHRAAPVDPLAAEHIVKNSQRVFSVKAGQNLLEGAEAAGLQPKFGCRRGICRTCQCKKLSGTVTNLLTGQVSGPGEELIQLCISSPQSALELAL